MTPPKPDDFKKPSVSEIAARFTEKPLSQWGIELPRIGNFYDLTANSSLAAVCKTSAIGTFQAASSPLRKAIKSLPVLFKKAKAHPDKIDLEAIRNIADLLKAHHEHYLAIVERDNKQDLSIPDNVAPGARSVTELWGEIQSKIHGTKPSGRVIVTSHAMELAKNMGTDAQLANKFWLKSTEALYDLLSELAATKNASLPPLSSTKPARER